MVLSRQTMMNQAVLSLQSPPTRVKASPLAKGRASLSVVRQTSTSGKELPLSIHGEEGFSRLMGWNIHAGVDQNPH